MEKIPVNTSMMRVMPGETAMAPIKCLIEGDAFIKMSSVQKEVAIKAAYPDYDKELAQAYLNGAVLGAQMLGLPPEACNDFIGRWAAQDEYMLVASLYATAKNESEAFQDQILAANGGGISTH